MSYSPEQIARLKELIHDHLEKNKVFDTVKNMLEEEAISEALSNDKILEVLGNQGVLGDVLTHVQQLPESEDLPGIDRSKKYLLFKLQYGKAFIDFLSADSSRSNLQIHISFLQQRFSSKSIPCSAEPIFDDSFLLNLSPPDYGNVDFGTLLKLRAPIHIVVIKETNGRKEIVASKNIEWRLMLSTPMLSFPIELTGLGTRAKMPIGVIYAQMDLMPRIKRGDLLTDRVVNEQLNLEAKYEREIAHSYFEYSNEWWRDYKQIRPTHEKRRVQIYAEVEDGSYKPVSSLVQPFKTNRLIDSPLHAARFVSLIPFEREEAPGGTRNEKWNSMHTFLVKGYGDCEDHAVLLAGLLLGFGLDAYVCIGCSGEGPHAWVITLGDRVTFWESLTGQRFYSDDPRIHRYYRKIGCAFNHKSFYANIQVDDIVANTNWDLQNESLWKAMAPDILQSLIGSAKYLPLLSPIPNPQEEEIKIENELRGMIVAYRERMDLLTHWDEDLSYLLQPALVNYEMDRIGSVTFGNEEFQQSIKRHVPEGHTFKAFPTQLQQRRVNDIMGSITKASVAQDILQTRGDTVRFALRIKLVAYPEERCAVWVMLAVRYRSVV
ncbi:unnamed protein product [Blepharisma stoltei]|uniref:Centrosomal protein of 76 kDa n=1 Tax=Blepharisma stoltei TaxID=1481888 RepID=A0AAU9KCC6_9CILI|nr:unnamed protein product [Blepharisma stoltei]